MTPPQKTPGLRAGEGGLGCADRPPTAPQRTSPGDGRRRLPAPRRLRARAPRPARPAPPALRRGVLTRREAVGSRQPGGHGSRTSSCGGRPHPSAPKIAISQQARQRQPPRRWPRKPRPPAATRNPHAALADTRPSPHPLPGHAPPPADPTPPFLGSAPRARLTGVAPSARASAPAPAPAPRAAPRPPKVPNLGPESGSLRACAARALRCCVRKTRLRRVFGAFEWRGRAGQ